ncbi:MAG: acetyl-CoA acetyltransferase [Desulfitobacteriaceae bacterium]|nr:acetyl-CoA acetyltransferase [Desulfitobacteriaceae bacterium]
MAGSIKDRVAIVGMGCTRFGERWDAGLDDLIVEAVSDCTATSGIEIKDVEAFWFGSFTSSTTGALPFSLTMKTPFKPVTRVENMCATGTDAFRNACYAVASGVYDLVMAIGAEKLKDSGYSGLETPMPHADRTTVEPSAPARFAFLAPAYAHKYQLSMEHLKTVMARIAWKNHHNGALNPKAQYQQEVSMETIRKSPMVAYPLSIMDSSGVADGATCALICRAEDAHKYRKNPVYVKAVAIAAGSGFGERHQDYDYTTVLETYFAAQAAYQEAGIRNPREAISLAEVHDCFTITELVNYEDLMLAPRGMGWRDVESGFFELGGGLPVNPDGGLKSFGHPVGATGLRMLYEAYLQLRGEAGKRQINNPRLALTHNLGGQPSYAVASVCIVGNELG